MRRAGPAAMSSNDIHGIEHGWTVRSADGESIGSVEETTETYILVKSGLLNPTHRYLPAAALAHVRPEVKEIGVSLSRDDVEQGDWSQAPTELPRSEGAPLNDDTYDEPDPVLAGQIAEPDRPDDMGR